MASVRALSARTDDLLPADRLAFRKRIGGASRIRSEKKRTEVLGIIERELDAAAKRAERRPSLIPAKLEYPDLPITEWRAELLDTLRAHQVVVVAGETGSGKSTQLPKLLLEAGAGRTGLIGHTQPRRIAARSIAERVAEEMGSQIGALVGYTVRFTDRVGDETLVKVMTDGILLNEIHSDPDLLRYDALIIDEAHERSLNIDFLLGYLSTLLPRRPDLKVVITSATIDTERFAEHFGGAPVVEVSGRSYPVEVRYRPLEDADTGRSLDQADGIIEAVTELFTEGDGDILVFCSGEREIRDAVDAIEGAGLPHTEVVPLFGRLSAAEQHRVFEAHTGRRVVVSTNVAETSLTVPGIRYVVDTGVARISRYGKRARVQRLPIEPISQASANQRAGRCGRLGPGVCVRLYAEDDFLTRDEFTEPEILRTNLASVILQMGALGLGDIESFPFVDPPDRRSIRDGVELLIELGAVDPGNEGTDRWLTPVGRKLARLPVDPRLGRMLLEADRLGCLSEMLVIVSGLAIQDPRERPLGLEQQADQKHARHRDDTSDLLTWVHLWQYLRREQRDRSSSAFRRMCRTDFLNYRRVREWQDVHGQLREACIGLDLHRNRVPADPEVVHRAAVAALLSHIGRKEPEGHEYRGARQTRFAINPGSTLFKKAPEWVMAGEIVETTRTWARHLAPIDPVWAEEAGDHLVKRSWSDPWWDEGRGSASCFETVTLYGLQLASDRVVQYRRADPVDAREMFLLHALVRGEWQGRWDFIAHNAGVLAEVDALEARHRRTDFLLPEADLVAWFADRVPDDVTGAGAFNQWWKDQRRKTPNRLHLSLGDVLAPDAEADDEAFPEEWLVGDVEMPLDYELDPGTETDGFIVRVPLEGLERIDPATFDWLVPGLREELVTTLMRALPKPLRRQFVPIPDTVAEILPSLDPSSGTLIGALRAALNRRGEVPLPVDAFDLGGLPSHLRPYFEVVDADGQLRAEGPDLDELVELLRDEARAAVTTAAHPIEQHGLTEWSFGELPGHVVVGEGPTAAKAYPTLGDEGDSVSIRLVASTDERDRGMWEGTRRLLALLLVRPERILRPLLDPRTTLAIGQGLGLEEGDWMDDCLRLALDTLLHRAGGPPTDATGFDRIVGIAEDSLAEIVDGIGRDSIRLGQAVVDLRGRLDRLTAPAFLEVVAGVRDHLTELGSDGWLRGLGDRRVSDLVRYVEAMGIRLDRYPEDQARDARSEAVVDALRDELDRARGVAPRSAALLDVRWMIEEFRVSLHAQALGTRGKVSEQRIRKAIEAALR
jgi:ATP-dependent helicase HrpA